MKTSVFGTNTSIKNDPNLQTGARYSESLYSQEGNIAYNEREKGFVAGNKISTILLNTALHQISYILCGVLGNTLNSLEIKECLGSLWDNTTDKLFNDKTNEDNPDIDTTDTDSITKATNTLIRYLEMLNKMCSKDINNVQHKFGDKDVVTVGKCQILINYIFANEYLFNFNDAVDTIFKSMEDNKNIIANFENTYIRIMRGDL